MDENFCGIINDYTPLEKFMKITREHPESVDKIFDGKKHSSLNLRSIEMVETSPRHYEPVQLTRKKRGASLII
jgi:hypothetical protein